MEYQEYTFDELVQNIASYNPEADRKKIQAAYQLASKAHEGQKRKSGQPYITHPLQVAYILSELRMDEASIIAGIMHDTVEDTPVTLEEVEKVFGAEIRQLVDGVTKINKINFRNPEQKQAENFRKMILAMAKDIRVIIVKLADRMHNMRTMGFMSDLKSIEIAQETLDIYAPIANRLGIAWMKVELEDLAFRYVKPEMYYKIADKINEKKGERDLYVNTVMNDITNKLNELNISSKVSGRPKHFYSIFNKMQEKNLEFDQVYDMTAFRIIVDTVPHCYEVLGHIHTMFKPLPGRFKDYIAIPKPNRYQSLHTTVLGPKARLIEIQIRTQEMHEVAERGIAAHWAYKEYGKNMKEKMDQFQWLRNLLTWEQDIKDTSEFLEAVKLDLFAGDIYVFTPKGHIFELTAGSCPLDLAYAIHTELGNNCVGAKVNGRMVPLNSALHSGDIVEILSNKNQVPSKDWLKFVKTSKAKAKIRYYIQTKERETAKELGEQILEKELRKYKLNYNTLSKSGELEKIAKEKGFPSIGALLINIGTGKQELKPIIYALKPELEQEEKETSKTKNFITNVLKSAIDHNPFKKVMPASAAALAGRTAIRVKGVDDILVRYANCCRPIPGDNIVGFITRGRGVTIHRRDCPKMLDSDETRKVEIEWTATKAARKTLPVKVRVICHDQRGLLVKISQVFYEGGINIVKMKLDTLEDEKCEAIFEIEVNDSNQLRGILMNLQKDKGILSAERIMPEK